MGDLSFDKLPPRRTFSRTNVLPIKKRVYAGLSDRVYVTSRVGLRNGAANWVRSNSITSF